ncbi:hypothetical protein AB0M79_01295 [Polymorphospora sp. NPDC051019]|uniref:hypothetical protein n=1 Tax=Polymorphospora sp. NPDC051019 TaxID=3155725 RepID=UPI00342ADA69
MTGPREERHPYQAAVQAAPEPAIRQPAEPDAAAAYPVPVGPTDRQVAAPAGADAGTAAVAAPAAAAQAAVAAATVTRATGRAAAVAAAAPPAPATTGTVYGQPPPGDPRRGPAGRLARLRIGSHTVSRAALSRLRVPTATAGLVLGVDRNRIPVPVRFFRPEPTRTALVGGTWAAQLVVLRALALSARVVVVTTDPAAWYGFGERVTGHDDRLQVHPGGQPELPAGNPQQPALLVQDLGLAAAAAAPPLGAWQTRLTVLRRLDQSAVSTVQDSQLVLMQRLDGLEAPLAASTLRLAAHSEQFLQVMAHDMVAVMGDGTSRYLWLAQTEIERHFTGPPGR